MLCSSQVRYRGSPHLNCDPFSPGREGFLAGLPDTVQAATAHTALGRAEGWAGSAAPCPCPRSQPEPPLSPGLSGRRNFPASVAPLSSEMLPGSSPHEHWLLLPLVSVPEIYTTASRCSKKSCTPGSGCSDVFFKSPICQPRCSRKAG